MPATVAELATRNHVEIGYLLVLQGCPFMFTDRAELAGTGVSSWIGNSYGPRRVLEGLDMRGTTITYGTETGDGRPETDDDLTFKIMDFARELIAFFAEKTEVAQIGRVSPLMDPAPAMVIAVGGDLVGLWGKWINSEAIGPAGQRSYYSLLPGGDGFGQDHAATFSNETLAPSYVFDPTHLEGRRVGLYRIFRDVDTGDWPGWETQYLSGESLIWVGSLTNDIEVLDIEWTLKAEGPSSWLRKQLGAQRSTGWLPVSSQLVLDTTPGQREDLIGLKFFYQGAYTGTIEAGGESFFTVSDEIPAAGTPDAIRSAINSRALVVSALPGVDITWSTHAEVEVGLEGMRTRIDTDVWDSAKAGIWRLAMHEKVWIELGYDVYAQKATAYETDLEIKFSKAADSDFPGAPGPGYWVGQFWTVPVGFVSPFDAGFKADNGGSSRDHKPIASDGLVQFSNKAGFEVGLGAGDLFFMEGQSNRPPVEYSISGAVGAVDAQGYAAFRGSYLPGTKEGGAGDAETTTMVQLAQICWAVDESTIGADTVKLDDLSAARVYVSKLIDGRFHGIDRPPLDRVWSAADLEWCPVNFLGYNFASGDFAHRILLRLMLSTGTAYWTGYEGAAVLTVGKNHPAVLDGKEIYSDAEIADLGLAIPYSLIDLSSFGKAPQALPKGINSALNRCRYAWIGAQDSQELLATILEPRGWGLGFCRSKWRLFARPDQLTMQDVEVVIGPGDIVGEMSFVETASLRPFSPRERWKVDFSRALVEEAATEDRDLTRSARALDPASRSRRDNGEVEVQGWGLIPIPLWRGKGSPEDWALEWGELFSYTMATWCNAAHVMIKGLTVLPSIARQVGPGTVVRFTSYYAPTREGTYGPTAKLGRVYKVEHDLDSREAKIDVLLQPGDPMAARYFAPIAMVLDDVTYVEQRHDAATRTFFCYENAFRHDGEDMHDVTAFAEPEWLGVGGDALVYGWQWDGRTWAQTFSFLVDTVSQAGNSITYKAGSFTGNWVSCQYTALVFAPYDSQPEGSWTRSLFAVITRPDGKFGAVPTQGFKLV